MSTWDLLTSLGSIHRLRLNIFLPCRDPANFSSLVQRTAQQFDLSSGLVEFIPVESDIETKRDRDLWKARDRMVIRSAEILVPISVRSCGQLQAMIDREIIEGRNVNAEFEVPYNAKRDRLAYRVDQNDVNPGLGRLGAEYLVHWTRTSNGPWPGERLIDYYRAVISSDRYPRSARDALLNIVTGGMIRATSKHMPGNAATVSFSGRRPSDMLELIRWRLRYREMSFEPYGIGIERKTALDMGVRPVVYYDKEDDLSGNAPEPRPDWTTQSRGVKTDWRAEDEYRFPGDFHLNSLDKSRLVLFCRTSAEADELIDMTGIRTIAFER